MLYIFLILNPLILGTAWVLLNYLWTNLVLQTIALLCVLCGLGSTHTFQLHHVNGQWALHFKQNVVTVVYLNPSGFFFPLKSDVLFFTLFKYLIQHIMKVPFYEQQKETMHIIYIYLFIYFSCFSIFMLWNRWIKNKRMYSQSLGH